MRTESQPLSVLAVGTPLAMLGGVLTVAGGRRVESHRPLDFRPARGLRVGLSPLSTSLAELATALAHIHQILKSRHD